MIRIVIALVVKGSTRSGIIVIITQVMLKDWAVIFLKLCEAKAKGIEFVMCACEVTKWRHVSFMLEIFMVCLEVYSKLICFDISDGNCTFCHWFKRTRVKNLHVFCLIENSSKVIELN